MQITMSTEQGNFTCDLLAFTGRKGAGKSTATAHCVENGYFELAFAEPLKQLVITLFGIDPKWVYDPEFKEVKIPGLEVSGRELCQAIGTECFRDALPRALPQLRLRGGSIWIHALLADLDRRRERGDSRFVVSDCRFEDEYCALRHAGFHTLEIARPELAENAFSTHASEQGCPRDGLIINDGSRELLWTRVQPYLKIENLESCSHATASPNSDSAVVSHSPTMSSAPMIKHLNECRGALIQLQKLDKNYQDVKGRAGSDGVLQALTQALKTYARHYNKLDPTGKTYFVDYRNLRQNYSSVTLAEQTFSGAFSTNPEWTAFRTGMPSSSTRTASRAALSGPSWGASASSTPADGSPQATIAALELRLAAEKAKNVQQSYAQPPTQISAMQSTQIPAMQSTQIPAMQPIASQDPLAMKEAQLRARLAAYHTQPSYNISSLGANPMTNEMDQRDRAIHDTKTQYFLQQQEIANLQSRLPPAVPTMVKSEFVLCDDEEIELADLDRTYPGAFNDIVIWEPTGGFPAKAMSSYPFPKEGHALKDDPNHITCYNIAFARALVQLAFSISQDDGTFTYTSMPQPFTVPQVIDALIPTILPTKENVLRIPGEMPISRHPDKFRNLLFVEWHVCLAIPGALGNFTPLTQSPPVITPDGVAGQPVVKCYLVPYENPLDPGKQPEYRVAIKKTTWDIICPASTAQTFMGLPAAAPTAGMTAPAPYNPQSVASLGMTAPAPYTPQSVASLGMTAPAPYNPQSVASLGMTAPAPYTPQSVASLATGIQFSAPAPTGASATY
jgi:hypothetical protein